MNNKKLIYKDCYSAMRLPILFYIANKFIMNIATIFTAMIIGNFADAVLKLDVSYTLHNIWNLLICFAITVIVVPVIGLISNVFWLKGGLEHGRTLFKRFLDQEYYGAMQMEAGEVQYRLENDPIDFRYYWGEILTNFIVAPITMVFLLYNALKINVTFCLLTFILALAKLVLPIAIKKLEAKYDLQNREYNTIIRAFESEIAAQPYIVSLMRLRKAFIDKIDNTFNSYYKSTFKKDILCKAASSNISTFIDTVSILIVSIIGAFFVSADSITAGAVAAMMGYFSVFGGVLDNISFNIRKIPVLNNLLQRLLLFYDNSEKLTGVKCEVEISSIIIENLSFFYDEASPVLNNISAEIYKNEKIAVCGVNGSGKSTFIKIMSKLLKDYSGSIKVNGTELRNISVEDWHSHIAFAEQDPFIFTGTVLDNIKVGRLSTNDAEVEQAMKQAGILHLKDRKIAMADNGLSGGEKQRISIARALLKDTPIIILDEPGNNLDEEGVLWLCQFIAKTEKTIIFISHDNILTACANKKINL